MKRPQQQRPRLKPSDLRAEAQRLIRAGKMPTLQQVLDAIDEVKRKPRGIEIPDFDEDTDTLLLRNRKGGQQ
jgi:hypothetical protein